MTKPLTCAAGLLLGVATFMLSATAATARCLEQSGPQTTIAATLVLGSGAEPTAVALRLLPGGVAEYEANGKCTLLAFTALRDGSAIYTDDGLGRGLTVAVGKDGALTISHVAGWVAKGQ